MIKDVVRLLTDALRDQSQSADPPAVAIIDDEAGASVVSAARAADFKVRPYLVTFGERPRYQIQQIAGKIDDELRVVELPTKRFPADFIRLAVQHRCFGSGDFEIGLVAMHLCEVLTERVIWLPVRARQPGWSAAVRIASAFGKTLINPFILLPPYIVLDERELESARRRDRLAK